MKRLATGTAGLLMLCACGAAPLEIQSKPVKAAFTKEISTAKIAERETKMAIRAYQPGSKPNTRGSEIRGATCTVVSDILRAKVVTPQEVILPAFKQRGRFENRGVPPSLLITCEAGKASGKALVPAQEKEIATATGAGIVGALVTVAVTSAVASSTPWVFPPLATVVLKE